MCCLAQLVTGVAGRKVSQMHHVIALYHDVSLATISFIPMLFSKEKQEKKFYFSNEHAIIPLPDVPLAITAIIAMLFSNSAIVFSNKRCRKWTFVHFSEVFSAKRKKASLWSMVFRLKKLGGEGKPGSIHQTALQTLESSVVAVYLALQQVWLQHGIL